MQDIQRLSFLGRWKIKNIGEYMNKKSKLILASAVFIAALMLLVPLSQANMSGGGGTGKSHF